MFLVAEAVTIDVSAIQSAMTSAITPAVIATMLASIITAGMGYYLMWMGTRKLVTIFTNAVSKGKIKV